MNSIQERLQVILDHAYNGSVTRFLEDNPNISKNSFYRYMRGDTPSYDFLVHMYRNGFNLYWLMFGIGSIYENSNAGKLKKIVLERERDKLNVLLNNYAINEPKKDYSTLPDASGTYTNLEGTNQ